MRSEDIIVRVMLKPNCGLENTRAALVVRRVEPLCDSVSCHPRTVKRDPNTVAYLRDHGLFIRFTAPQPEQVLLAIRGAFFVDCCDLVDDPDAIPPLAVPDGIVDGGAGALDPLPAFADRDARTKRDDELTDLLARFEETGRALRAHAESLPRDRVLNDISFSHAQAVDELRTVTARSRIEPFDRIASSLRQLADDYGRRFGIAVDLRIAAGHLALDRAVLASMEEILKRAVRSCIRDGIEKPEERLAAGKPARATLGIRVENDGSDVVCRIEHDGWPFNPMLVGEIARERGLLARPFETYSDEELGAFLLLPRFVESKSGNHGDALAEFNEIGSMLQHIGGHGEVRNTERGTLEIALSFPVPFTVLEVALLRTGESRFALPAQQILRFEAFRVERVVPEPDDPAAGTTWYASETGKQYELLNAGEECGVFATESPRYIILLDALGEKRALAVDAIGGYERVSVNRLPALLDRRAAREAGCIGYAVLADGSPCAVMSLRRLLQGSRGNGGRHA